MRDFANILISFALASVLLLPPSSVSAQESGEAPDSSEDAPVLRLQAIYDKETGEVTIVEKDGPTGQADPNLMMGDMETPTGAGKTFPDFAAYAEGEASGFGVLVTDSSGRNTQVLASANTGMYDPDKLSGLLADGNTLTPVPVFSLGSRLPTREEAQDITQAAIDGAIERVCAMGNKPRTLKTVVSIGVSLGLEGRFDLEMEWNPREDCTE